MLFYILSETDRKKVGYLCILILLAVEGGIHVALGAERFCLTKSKAQSIIIPLRKIRKQSNNKILGYISYISYAISLSFHCTHVPHKRNMSI